MCGSKRSLSIVIFPGETVRVSILELVAVDSIEEISRGEPRKHWGL
jgi:hypothetical protein